MRFKKYQPKHQKKTVRRLSASAKIAYLLIAVVLTSSVTFSRYSTSASGSDGARVARYAFQVTDGGSDAFSLLLDGLKAPGDEQDVVFVVTNKAADICEVTQEYAIAYDSTGNLPLKFDLTSASNGQGTLYSQGQKGILPAAQEAVHTYTLTVTWDPSENDPQLADEIDKVTIQIHAEQRNQ